MCGYREGMKEGRQQLVADDERQKLRERIAQLEAQATQSQAHYQHHMLEARVKIASLERELGSRKRAGQSGCPEGRRPSSDFVGIRMSSDVSRAIAGVRVR